MEATYRRVTGKIGNYLNSARGIKAKLTSIDDTTQALNQRHRKHGEEHAA